MSYSSDHPLPSDTAISIRNISRLYLLFDRPEDRLKHALWRGRKKFYTDFWALKGVSFEVKKGESVGIIGKNGSGKSTLLQIIAGVLKPTEGEVLVRGRVSALLELGSGFSPELTGRENIYLQGNILGLSTEKVNENFDDIASFADIGDFIDQPIKIYSSGMAVRLAFSVLAHLEPDILIVDEALAVGDVSFQLKCRKHIKKLIENGTTLLFVSHDPYTIKNLCQRSLWLHEGVSKFFGDCLKTATLYQDFLKAQDANQKAGNTEINENIGDKMGANKALNSSEVAKGQDIKGEKQLFCRLISEKLLDVNNKEITELHRGETLKVRVTYEVLEEKGPLSAGIAIFDSGGYHICGTNTHIQNYSIPSSEGIHKFEVIYNNLNLFSGTYRFDVGLFNQDTTVFFDFHSHCLTVKIIDTQHVGDGLILLDHTYAVL